MSHLRAVDEGDSKKYWTQIPNIVFELGLKPFELVLYAHIKRVAGCNGKCTKSTATLARETGIGAGSISRAKSALTKPRADLNNKPLIKIRDVVNPRGGKSFQEITLTDIWPDNMVRFSSSTVEVDRSRQVPHGKLQVPETQEPSSTVEIKKNIIDQEDLNKKNSPQPRPRLPGSDDDRRERQPEFHYSLLKEPNFFGYDIAATYQPGFPTLNVKELLEQWIGRRIVARGIGKKPRAKSTIEEYALDFHNFLLTCVDMRQNGNGNGNGHSKPADEYRGPTKSRETPQQEAARYACEKCNGTGTRMENGVAVGLCKHPGYNC